MTSQDEISSAFTAATEAFEPVVGAPSDDDIERVRRTIINLLQSFHFHGSKDSLSGLIKLKARYKSRYGHTFDRLEAIDQYDYDPDMPNEPKPIERARRESIFEAKKARSVLVSSTD